MSRDPTLFNFFLKKSWILLHIGVTWRDLTQMIISLTTAPLLQVVFPLILDRFLWCFQLKCQELASNYHLSTYYSRLKWHVFTYPINFYTGNVNMVSETKRSWYEGGGEENDHIPLGQQTMTSETQEATSSVVSTDSNVLVVEFPTFLDFTAGEPIKSNSYPYRCGGCGNHRNLCPEAVFGVFLCQEMVSTYESHWPQEVNNVVLETVYKDTFNRLLWKFCRDKFMKYDEKYHHNLPQCMVGGSLSYLKALVESMKAIEIIKQKCEYNMTLKHILWQQWQLRLEIRIILK